MHNEVSSNDELSPPKPSSAAVQRKLVDDAETLLDRSGIGRLNYQNFGDHRMQWKIVMLAALIAGRTCSANDIQIYPEQIQLAGLHETSQILVLGKLDLTRDALFSVVDPSIATIDQRGLVRPLASGKTKINISIGDRMPELPIEVQSPTSRGLEFSRDIRPILNKSGCASAACHAAQHGQGGFKLSVFGFDVAADYNAIAQQSRSRRIDAARPDASLILRKASGSVTHGGGTRFATDSVSYHTFRRWIADGAIAPTEAEAELKSLSVFPTDSTLTEGSQQLRIEATFADGTTRDVTAMARYDSLDPGVAEVDESGLVNVVGKGQTSIMIRYEGEAVTSNFVVPYSQSVQLADWRNNNFVDELAVVKFKQLGIEPSPLCSDATFIRRVYLDAIGTLPTIEQTQAFLASQDPDKRQLLIDRLLGLTGDPTLDTFNDAYAAYWTLKWSDLIRNNSGSVGEQGMWALHNWIKEKFRVNEPFDAFVRELVTAKGSIYSSGPANFFRIHTDSSSLAEATSQLFLGVRLECAKCHHHPFEKYSQADYYGLAAFFARVGSKTSEDFGLFGRETVVMVRETGDVSHPRTRQRMQPTPLGGQPVEETLDRRIPFADWLTSKDNTYFSRSIVNRYVGYLLGTGLVDPIDDMRSTNPPSNVELMDALANHFIEHDFDLKQLMRAIMSSRLYQLSSQPTPENASDMRFYSHYQVKRLPAEPLLDAIDQATGVATKFRNLPLGTRAIELPDAEYPNYFLTTFAKPRRATVCECERSADANLAQALHTANGDILAAKIADKQGRVAKLIAENKPHDEIVSELLATILLEHRPTRRFSRRNPFERSPIA
ncbi:MAG: DUF1549 domain-containing protein [Pirellulaceae bacterium]